MEWEKRVEFDKIAQNVSFEHLKERGDFGEVRLVGRPSIKLKMSSSGMWCRVDIV
jgi:hypothetical protein